MKAYLLRMSCVMFDGVAIGVFDSKDKCLDTAKEIVENREEYSKETKFDIQEFELNKLLYDVEVLRTSAKVKISIDERIDKI